MNSKTDNGVKEEREIPISDADDIVQSNVTAEESIASEKPEVTENYLDLLLRLKAEFANYKRRIERERSEIADIIRSELIYKLLPIIDDFELMISHIDGKDDDHVKGFKTIYKRMMSILESEGVSAVDSIGKQFDPTVHEAVMIEPGSIEDDNKIIEEWQKGYLYKSKLLRVARVKVIKHRG